MLFREREWAINAGNTFLLKFFSKSSCNINLFQGKRKHRKKNDANGIFDIALTLHNSICIQMFFNCCIFAYNCNLPEYEMKMRFCFSYRKDKYYYSSII